MAATAHRRVQREIEIAEKKVYDGVKEFNELWTKVEDAQDAKDRDKLMSDMKRELKRLQRLREQFRAWAEDPSIRDCKVLFDMRRLVETQMERFKDLEKEAKIKPFAKAGLQQKEKIDPAVEAKLSCEAWLGSCIARLAEQVEQFEADAEALMSGCNDKKPPPRVEELHGYIAKHQEQSAKLEQVLRLVENEQVGPPEVDEMLKDSIEHYLECSTQPDFVEDELMFQGFPLGEGLEGVGRIRTHDAKQTGEEASASEAVEALKKSKAALTRTPSAKRAGKAAEAAAKASARKAKKQLSSPASAPAAMEQSEPRQAAGGPPATPLPTVAKKASLPGELPTGEPATPMIVVSQTSPTRNMEPGIPVHRSPNQMEGAAPTEPQRPTWTSQATSEAQEEGSVASPLQRGVPLNAVETAPVGSGLSTHPGLTPASPGDAANIPFASLPTLEAAAETPLVMPPVTLPADGGQQRATVTAAEARQQQLLLGRKSFAQAASGTASSLPAGLIEEQGAAQEEAGGPTPMDPLLVLPPAPPPVDIEPQEQSSAMAVLAKLKEALECELAARKGLVIAAAGDWPYPWQAIRRATGDSLEVALLLLRHFDPQLLPPHVADCPAWVHDIVNMVLGHLQTAPEILPAVGEGAPPPPPAARSSTVDVNFSEHMWAGSAPRPEPPFMPTSLLTGSLDSLETARYQAATHHRPGLGVVHLPSSREMRRPRLDLSQVGRERSGGGHKGKGRRGHKVGRVQAAAAQSQEHGLALAWVHGAAGLSQTAVHRVRTPPGFAPLPPEPRFLPRPAPPPRRVSAASEPPFLDREHEKPYYLSNIRHPLERNLFAASLQNMPQEDDRGYMATWQPVSVFARPRSHCRPAVMRAVEWPLPEMWNPEVISKMDSDSFFEDLPQCSWLEIALFSFTFQPGTTQQMRAAEVLKKQGWMFNSQHGKWFHRPESEEEGSREVSSSCESGKWIVWEPNLGEDETGWSAHVTDDNFSFMFEHLVE